MNVDYFSKIASTTREFTDRIDLKGAEADVLSEIRGALAQIAQGKFVVISREQYQEMLAEGVELTIYQAAEQRFAVVADKVQKMRANYAG